MSQVLEKEKNDRHEPFLFEKCFALIYQSGQISSRPHTTDFPQKIAFWKGNGTPYFREIQVDERLLVAKTNGFLWESHFLLGKIKFKTPCKGEHLDGAGRSTPIIFIGDGHQPIGFR